MISRLFKSHAHALSIWVILAIATSVTLSGCVTSSAVKKDQQSSAPPNWYINPPDDSQSSYFGVGEGRTKRDAENQALAQISSRISVKIESSTDSTTRSRAIYSAGVSNEFATENSQQRVKAAAQTIEFSNYRVVQSSFTKNRFQALVEVDRRSLAKDLRGKLDQFRSALQSDIRLASSQSPFNLAALATQIDQQLSGTQAPLLRTLSAVDPTFDRLKWLDQIADLVRPLEEAKQRLVIKIEAPRSPAYRQVLEKHLTLQGITLLSGRSQKNVRDQVILSVQKQAERKQFKTTNNQLKDVIFVDVTLDFTVKDRKGALLARNSVTVRNSSRKDFKDALSNTQSFDQLLTEQGPLRVISGL